MTPPLFVKIVALFICSLVLLSGSQAQTAGPEPNPEANWLLYETNWGNFSVINPIGVVGDTLIDNQSYHRLMQSTDTLWSPVDAIYYGALRVEDEKWYYRKADGSQDALICDFGLSEGDTILIDHEWSGEATQLRVNHIDTLITNGVPRKQLHLYLLDGWVNPNLADEIWIEGIGSTKGLNHSGNHIFDAGHLLSCYHEGEELHYLSPISNDYSGGCYVTTSMNEHAQPDLSVHPNPTRGRIVFEGSTVNHLFVYDTEGRKVLNALGNSINLSPLPDGMYIVVAMSKNQTHQRRIVLNKGF